MSHYKPPRYLFTSSPGPWALLSRPRFFVRAPAVQNTFIRDGSDNFCISVKCSCTLYFPSSAAPSSIIFFLFQWDESYFCTIALIVIYSSFKKKSSTWNEAIHHRVNSIEGQEQENVKRKSSVEATEEKSMLKKQTKHATLCLTEVRHPLLSSRGCDI